MSERICLDCKAPSLERSCERCGGALYDPSKPEDVEYALALASVGIQRRRRWGRAAAVSACALGALSLYAHGAANFFLRHELVPSEMGLALVICSLGMMFFIERK